MSRSPVPGALQLSDSGIALVQNGETFLQAELVNDLLIPDPSHPSFAEIQGSLSILGEGEGLGSRYINEYFVDSIASDLFFESDLLSTHDGPDRAVSMEFELSKIDGAVEQLDWPLRLFLDGKT